MFLVESISDGVESREGDFLSDESQQDHQDPFELEGHVVAVDEDISCLPVDDLNQGMNQETDLLEERVTQLNCLVVKLNIFAELTGQQLHEHLTFESRMPGLLHVVQPLLADPSHLEQLASRQVRVHMVNKGLGWQIAEL